MKKIFFFFAFNILIIGQSNDYLIYNTGSTSDITAIVKDNNSVIWLGTKSDGLIKFEDGTFTNFNGQNSPFPNTTIWALAVDQQNNLWIATQDSGLIKFDGTNWTFFNMLEIAPRSQHNSAWEVEVDDENNIWVGTYWAGLAKYDQQNWTIYDDTNSPIPSGQLEINAIAFDNLGNLWYGSDWQGYGMFDRNNYWEIYPEWMWVYCIAIESNNDVWLNGDGLKKLSSDSVITNYQYQVQSFSNYAIAIDNKDRKWMAQADSCGIYYVENDVFKSFYPAYSEIQNARTYSIYIDDTNTKWVGYSNGYLLKYSYDTPLDFFNENYLLDINRFIVPFDNKGVIADIYGSEVGRYDESTVLFSGGFCITGKNGNDTWAVANASASTLQDFQPGPVGSLPDDPINQLYIVKASDPPFGESWQNYNYAVMLGAKFYDGNHNGIYDPVDLNGNGTWDLNEDRPDMLGDETLWCVYNDGVPSELRNFGDMYPLGVEIKQTVFALGENLAGPIENMFFIRYIINNTGTVVQEIDSVIFCGWADPDIGDFVDDLVGCDTLLNTGYAYSNGDDSRYGINPPAIGISLLQGAVSYIQGETFIDNNSNEIFDLNIDTPLDSAFVNNGLFIGSNVFPGAKNTDQSSFVHYQSSDPFLGDPNDEIETRFYSTGYTRLGEIINPCTWGLGEVGGGVDCNLVNPFFWYSGDPVTDIGWINTNPTDQRIMTNTGTFKLKANEPVELWFAYVVGRGDNSLNSITKMKEHILYANNYYRSNFTYLPSDVFDETFIPGKFSLSQNYPNPFNPTTMINYQLPVTSSVSLKIYDILGREVATLVNQEQSTGSYKIDFNASSLASGVYFYQLKAGTFIETKKMILIK